MQPNTLNLQPYMHASTAVHRCPGVPAHTFGLNGLIKEAYALHMKNALQ